MEKKTIWWDEPEIKELLQRVRSFFERRVEDKAGGRVFFVSKGAILFPEEANPENLNTANYGATELLEAQLANMTLFLFDLGYLPPGSNLHLASGFPEGSKTEEYSWEQGKLKIVGAFKNNECIPNLFPSETPCPDVDTLWAIIKDRVDLNQPFRAVFFPLFFELKTWII